MATQQHLLFYCSLVKSILRIPSYRKLCLASPHLWIPSSTLLAEGPHQVVSQQLIQLSGQALLVGPQQLLQHSLLAPHYEQGSREEVAGQADQECLPCLLFISRGGFGTDQRKLGLHLSGVLP